MADTRPPADAGLGRNDCRHVSRLSERPAQAAGSHTRSISQHMRDASAVPLDERMHFRSHAPGHGAAGNRGAWSRGCRLRLHACSLAPPATPAALCGGGIKPRLLADLLLACRAQPTCKACDALSTPGKACTSKARPAIQATAARACSSTRVTVSLVRPPHTLCCRL